MDISFIEAFLALITLIITGITQDLIRRRANPQRMGNIVDMARLIVQGVEKYASDRGATYDSADKLALAVSALSTTAQRFGVKLSSDEATAIIHAALQQVQQLEELEAYTEPAVGFTAPEVTELNSFEPIEVVEN